MEISGFPPVFHGFSFHVYGFSAWRSALSSGLVLHRKWDEVRKKFLHVPQIHFLTVLIMDYVNAAGFQIDEDQVVCNDPKLEIFKLCLFVPSFRRFNASKNLVIQ